MNKIISIFLALLCLIMVISACSSCSLDTEETGTTYPNGNSVTTGVTSRFIPEADQNENIFPSYLTGNQNQDEGLDISDLHLIKAKARYQFGFSIGSRDLFLSELETAAQEECALLGVKMTVVSAENNSDVQLQSISMFVEQGCDAIIVNLVESSLADDVITLAAGTPVVFVNRIPDLELVRGESCFVGSDEMESGRLQGEFLSDYFKERDQTNIDVVMLKGQSGVRNTELRTEMVKLTLMENGITANYIYEVEANWEREKAEHEMENFLSQGRSFDCVICNNDEMALGVIDAMLKKNKNPQTIPVIGIDAIPVALKAMEKGTLSFTVFQNPVSQGSGCVRVATAFANGDDIGTTVQIPFEPVTFKNYKDYM
ncbi:MAG: substrate-binding domain-containing protein [Fastidiosipilaceae bacterium]|nr:substrate-binding domain-containing protein [Clostridiaceae bacterium]